MFIKKSLPSKKEEKKVFEFNLFNKSQNTSDEDNILEVGRAKSCYNFISEDGSLRSGYGFIDLVSPINEENLKDEYPFVVHGEEISKLLKLKWYDVNTDTDCYYLFYYNDANQFCFDDLFKERDHFFFFPTEYSSTPYITNYKHDKQDAILLSSKEGTHIISGAGWQKTINNIPAIVSCCQHYGKLFAITAKARGSLVYTDADVINWDDSLTKDLDFTDERGDLNKIISFNDYLYVFRDFGITQISGYASNKSFAVNHMYKSSHFIYPETIIEHGDNVYFVEGDRLKVFNGSSVKELDISCLNLIKNEDKRYMTAACYDGKYFLACRAFFDDGQEIGCEACQSGYKNNLLIIYTIASGHVDLLRGVDIRQMLALTNHLNSKLVACFYNDNKAKIGQLVKNGNIFGYKFKNVWRCGKTDFNMPGENKRISSFLLCSYSDCVVTLKSEVEEKRINVKGNVLTQEFKTNVKGKEFEIEISSASEQDDFITNFVVRVST